MLDSFFKISERGSTVAREVRGGFVTFFTMAYIVVLNPLIIGYTPDKYGNFIGGTKEPQIALIAAATALVAGVLTILMGWRLLQRRSFGFGTSTIPQTNSQRCLNRSLWRCSKCTC